MTSEHDDTRAGSAPARAGSLADAPGGRPLWSNPLTLLGAALAGLALMLLLTFALFQVVAPASNPYVDIIGYMVLPGGLAIGLILMPLGTLVRTWRLRRHDPSQRLVFRFPRVNLADPQQLLIAKIFVYGSVIVLPVAAVCGYQGYHYTDSTTFCAKACHIVMEPEATTHELSSHARVTCAECHIGAGASWFVKSKLSGTRQVFAMLAESYSRPIPPAIKHLRPARETCEECHWPERFYGDELVEIVRFAPDETNTRRAISMLLKTGGGGETTGRAHGIHVHTSSAETIEFVALDDRLQDIPWVRLTDQAGQVRVFRSDGVAGGEPPAGAILRRMDCMDCHNRPAHAFAPPGEAVDAALAVGKLDSSLPFIKRVAIEALLVTGDADAAAGRARIAKTLEAFYREQQAEVWQARQPAVEAAIAQVQALHDQIVFPYMRVDWRTYPNNIGHKRSRGCYRCHDGRHVDDAGAAISHACDNCHTFLNPVDPKAPDGPLQYGEFQHSIELAGPHAELRCDQCHGTARVLEPTCAGCHAEVADWRSGKLVAAAGLDLDLPAEPMADSLDCEDCHDLSKPLALATMAAGCVDCHDDKYGPMLQAWADEAKPLLDEAEAAVGADAERQAILEAVRRAGPLHNIEATRLVAGQLKAGDAAKRAATAEPSVRPGEGG